MLAGMGSEDSPPPPDIDPQLRAKREHAAPAEWVVRPGEEAARWVNAGADVRADPETGLMIARMPAKPPVSFSQPSAEERAQGIAARFKLEAGDTLIMGELARGDAGLVVHRVEVTAPLPGGVTQRTLRDTPLAGILRAARPIVAYQEAVSDALRILGHEPPPSLFRPEDVRIPQTSGRTPMTDELLKQVALAFIEETGPGKDKRAIQRMSDRFDRPEGTLRTWIGRARKEGWLAPGSKGRIGAEPGPKLTAAMRQRDKEEDAHGA